MPFRCRITHTMRGRIRLSIDSFQPFAEEWTKNFKTFLEDQQGVQEVRLNPHCRNVILSFNPNMIQEKKLLSLIEGLSLNTLRCYQSQSHHEQDQDKKQIQDSICPSWLSLALSSAAVVIGTLSESVFGPCFLFGASVPIFKRAIYTLTQQRKLSVDVLDASATTVLVFKQQFRTAAAMVWLVSLGDFIRDITMRRSHQVIERLFDGVDQFAWVVRHGKKIQLKVNEIQIGDEVVVYPGEFIPVDGLILIGKATVDQKILTGESMPVEKEPGNHVYAGTVVREGKLYLKAEKVGSETMKAKIIQLVNNAPAHETRAQNYAEHFANRLVPWSFFAAGVSFAVTGNTNTPASLLIVDYGTGIRVAAPTTVLSSMARAARNGILIKGGRYLEMLARIDTVVFDKTGTLTLGEPHVVEVIPYGKNRGPEAILALAAAAENRLTHPVAEAIVRAARQKGIEIPEREDSDYIIGLGVEAKVKESTVLVGCQRLMALKKIKIEKANQDIVKMNGQAASPLFVALDGKLIGLLIYSDPIRPEASHVIQALRQRGVTNLIMLTGDHPGIATKVANTLGITRYYADVFPEEKSEVVKKLQEEGHKVAVVGDGINDTPALIQADVGISVKGGADVAMETAHVSFLEGNLWKIPQAIDIARESIQLIEQNWHLNSYPNTAAITLALLGLVGPVGTTIMSNGAAVMASLNALRPLLNSSNGYN